MNRKMRNAIFLVITLIIGFAIGFLVSGRMIKSKVEDMRSYNTTMGFHHHLLRVIDPSPEQLNELEPILKKYAELNHDLLFDYKSDQHDLFLELQDELEPLLNADQNERISRWPKNRFFKNQQPPTDDRRHRNGPRNQGRHRGNTN